MGVTEDRLTLGVYVPRPVEQRQHRPSQGLRPAETRILGLAADEVRGQSALALVVSTGQLLTRSARVSRAPWPSGRRSCWVQVRSWYIWFMVRVDPGRYRTGE